MIFKEFGCDKNPTILLIHGGGLSWWMWKTQIEVLSKDYYVVTPILDGHGDDFNTDFENIENSAKKVIDYIKNNHNGKVLAMGGLSIGAQIVVEILSHEPDITEMAIIESALVYPIRLLTSFTVPMFNLFYGLIKMRWYARLQAKTLHVPLEMFDSYYHDSSRMTKKSLINMTISNGNYSLPPVIKNSKVNTLILVGEKEISVMRKSAIKLSKSLKHSTLKILPNYSHGEISILNSIEYINLCKSHLAMLIK